jgi:putative ABC transport system permease protein
VIATGDLRIAARALWAHKFRSALTVLSITIGAFAIVLMSSLAQSGLITLQRGIEDLGGARLLLVVPKDPERAEVRARSYELGLTRADRDRAFDGLPHVVGRSLYANMDAMEVLADSGESTSSDLVAGDSQFLDVYRLKLARGRTFTEEENDQHARVCVVGHVIAERLWRGDPIGRRMTIGGVRCLVIGVLADNHRFGVSFGFDWVKLVVMPGETVADVVPKLRERNLIIAKTDDASANDAVKRIVNATLSDRHHGIDDFTLYDFSGVMKKFHAVFVVMELLVGCIAGIALVIGGIGVMNMMLVSVSERVREIGIRKALGARPQQIRAQFLVEAALLAGVGGIAGAGLGALCAVASSALIANFLKSWVGVVSSGAVIAALATALGVGVIFGWFPARRAGALDPVEAMRR